MESLSSRKVIDIVFVIVPALLVVMLALSSTDGVQATPVAETAQAEGKLSWFNSEYHCF